MGLLRLLVSGVDVETRRNRISQRTIAANLVVAKLDVVQLLFVYVHGLDSMVRHCYCSKSYHCSWWPTWMYQHPQCQAFWGNPKLYFQRYYLHRCMTTGTFCLCRKKFIQLNIVQSNQMNILSADLFSGYYIYLLHDCGWKVLHSTFDPLISRRKTAEVESQVSTSTHGIYKKFNWRGFLTSVDDMAFAKYLSNFDRSDSFRIA